MSLNQQKKMYRSLVVFILFGMVGMINISQAKELSAEAKQYGYEGHVLLQKGQFSKAVMKLEKAQELGDARAMHSLGLMHINGDGVKKSYAKALTYFKKSYKHGYTNAAYDIGVMYKNGESVKKSLKTAEKYYLIAAKNNYRLAQIELAKLYGSLGNKKQFNYWAKKAQSHKGAK